MKPRQQRMILVLLFVLALGGAMVLALSALQETATYFYAPSDIRNKPPGFEEHIRLGGLVVRGSVVRSASEIRFTVTDNVHEIPVSYRGIVPDLFRESQGVVAEGKLGRDGQFMATKILAKHNEDYMSREVVEALKKSGEWRGPTRPDALTP